MRAVILRVWTISILLFFLAVMCRADRDIVYAARYYTPINSKVKSNFQLYRINPDGTGRTQLTHGKEDSVSPQWSPDGKRILYQQARDGALPYAVALMNADGKGERRLLSLAEVKEGFIRQALWSPDNRTIAVTTYDSSERNEQKREALFLIDVRTGSRRSFAGMEAQAWSPEGHILLLSDNRLLETASGKVSSPLVSREVGSLSWLDNSTLAVIQGGLTDDDKPLPVTLITLGLDGKVKEKTPIQKDPFTVWHFGTVHPFPGHGDWLLLAEYAGNSTTGVDHCYHRVNYKTTESKPFAEGQFLVWSPDGNRFLTAPGRDLKPLGKRKDGTTLTVWFAPLRLHDAEGKILRTLTPGIIWVTGCDWRKQSH